MKKVLLVCVFSLVGLACATTQSKSVESNITRQNVQESSTPPAENTAKDLFDKLKEANKKPTPPANPNPVDETAYIITELVRKKIKKTTLDQQPKEIVEYIERNGLTEKSFGSSHKEIKTYFEDRDINYDGIVERVIFAILHGDEAIPNFYVFSSENGKWNNCIFEAELGFPDGTPFKLELLAQPNQSKFDLIKVSDIYGDKEVMKDIVYYQMKDGKYEMFECRKVEGENEKTVACQ